MLLPLLVDIGTNSTCPSLRHELLRVMLRIIFAVESNAKGKDDSGSLNHILRDIPLAVYLYNTISTSVAVSKHLGVLVNALRLVHALLDKLPQLYIPLFENEGVFYELTKVTKLPPIISPSPSMQQLMNRLPTSSTGQLSIAQQTAPISTVTMAPTRQVAHRTTTSSVSARSAANLGGPNLAIRSNAAAAPTTLLSSRATPISSSSANVVSVGTSSVATASSHPAFSTPQAFASFLQSSSISTMTTPSIMFSGSGLANAIRAISTSGTGGYSSCGGVYQAKQLQEWAVKGSYL